MSVVLFRRLVLDLSHGAADPDTLREVAALARLLDAELHALFFEDDTLHGLTRLSFVREIGVVSRQWRPLDTGALEAGLRAAAERARRGLMEVADAIGARRRFEVRRGGRAAYVQAVCVTADIVVVPGPRHAGDASTHGFGHWRETARDSVAAVLFLPPEGRRGRAGGPVVAIVTGPADPAQEVAARIAALAKAESRALAMGEAVPGFAPPDVVRGLGEERESLIVMTRCDDPEQDGAALALARGVPVLVIEPV